MPPNDQRIEPLNAAELAWVRDELANARTLVELHCGEDAPDVLTPEILDEVYTAAYHAAPPGDADYANAVINAIGIAFGQYLVDTLGYEWCAVTDSHGQELAVVALPETAKALVFPPNLVAKRWESGTTDFLSYVYVGIKDSLDEFRRDWEQHDPPIPAESTPTTGFLSWLRRLI